jgi:hypothetical protein
VSRRQDAAARLAEAAAWPAWPGDEHAMASDQFNWAMAELHKTGLLVLAFYAVDPLCACDPAAWDQLVSALLERLPRAGQVSPALARYLTVRLVERCPDLTRQPRVAELVRLLLGGDRIAGRQIGQKPGAIMHAARYYYHWKRQGIAVGVREIAKHAGVSHGLAARWVARWKRGDV